MALGPQVPEPGRQERRLRDQAIFLGDLSRQQRSRQQQQEQEANAFRELCEESPASKAEVEVPLDDQRENRLDAERKSRRASQAEAEKESLSQSWQGPYAGFGWPLPPPSPLEVPLQGRPGEASGRARSKPAADLAQNQEQVEASLLLSLRQVEGAHPLTGLADPRLQEPAGPLGAGWQGQPLAGGWLWRWGLAGEAGQELRWSGSEQLLLSWAAGRRQVIHRVQGQTWSELSSQDEALGLNPLPGE